MPGPAFGPSSLPISTTQAKAPARPPTGKAGDKPLGVRVAVSLPGIGPEFELLVGGPQNLPVGATTKAGDSQASLFGKVERPDNDGTDIHAEPTPARQAANLASASAAAGPVSFAVLVNPEQQKASEADSQAQETGAAASEILSGSHTPALMPVTLSAQEEHKGEGSQDGLPTPTAETEGPKTPQSFSEHLETADAPKTAEPEAEIATPQAEPARQIHVQMAGDGNQRVDLRVIERDGTMSVSVRATDPNLNRTLQEHMPELTNRLEAEHFRAEVWVPKSSASAASSFEQGKSDSNTGYSGGNNPGQQQGGQRDAKPDWVDELEDYARNTQSRRK